MTLSGGEAQRVKLVAHRANYGLHFDDVAKRPRLSAADR
jgi:excinuclease UvrABC ATPase subunit